MMIERLTPTTLFRLLQLLLLIFLVLSWRPTAAAAMTRRLLCFQLKNRVKSRILEWDVGRWVCSPKLKTQLDLASYNPNKKCSPSDPFKPLVSTRPSLTSHLQYSHYSFMSFTPFLNYEVKPAKNHWLTGNEKGRERVRDFSSYATGLEMEIRFSISTQTSPFKDSLVSALPHEHFLALDPSIIWLL